MIHELLIVSKSGICIFSYSFSSMKIDPQLAAGFTTAIDTFSETLIAKHQNIEVIEMTELEIRYSPFFNNQLSMITFFNRYDNPQIIDNIILDLQNLFIEKFRQIDMANLFEVSLFSSFSEVVEALAHTHINIAIISAQGDYKHQIWALFQDKIEQVAPQPDRFNNIDLNFPDIKNCSMTVWNIDFEKIETSTQFIRDKHISLLVIEPNLKFIMELIPKIRLILDINRHSAFHGLILSHEGQILQHNIEILLNIPCFTLTLHLANTKQQFLTFIHNVVVGIQELRGE